MDIFMFDLLKMFFWVAYMTIDHPIKFLGGILRIYAIFFADWVDYGGASIKFFLKRIP